MSLSSRIRRGLPLADGGVPVGTLDLQFWSGEGSLASEDLNKAAQTQAEARAQAEAQAQAAEVQARELERQEAYLKGREAGRLESEEALKELAEALRRAAKDCARERGRLAGEVRGEIERRLQAAAKALAGASIPESMAAAARAIAADAARVSAPLPLVLGCDPASAGDLKRLLGEDEGIRVEARPGLAKGALAVQVGGATLEALPEDFSRVAVAAARGEEPEEAWRAVGTVVRTRGPLLEAEGLRMNLGDLAEVGSVEHPLLAEAVGFDGGRALLSPLGDLRGVGPGERVASLGRSVEVPVGKALLGYVVDALGRPLEDKPLPEGLKRIPVHTLHGQRDPMALGRVQERFETGVSAVDAFLTCGLGQRLGIFSGSGVGKSTLLGMLARRCDADAVVIGLIGERGREVRDFLERVLGPEGRKRSVVVVATSDQPPALRVQAALTATAMAESLRDEGLKVLLLMDSVTRFAQSLREIGLSLGEPPATRGYPPSVFAALPRLLERAGPLEKGGSITAFYTVLVEGDDMNEPIADAVRGTLDGHLVLTRSVAEGGRYPAVDVLSSLSRCMPEVVPAAHLALAQKGRKLFGSLDAVRDLISVGAYREGSDPVVDEARRVCPRMEELMRQSPEEIRPMDKTLKNLGTLLAGAAS